MIRDEYVNEMVFNRGCEIIKASLCVYKFSSDYSYRYTEKCIHPSEEEIYNSLNYGKSMKNYLLGRYVAKKAISEFIHQPRLNEILIGKGIFNQPIILKPSNQNIRVTITHCSEYGVAVAFPQGYPMGVDLEIISDRNNRVAETQLTIDEKELIYMHKLDPVLLWTIKESLSKILMTGISSPFKIYEIDKLNFNSNYIVSFFKNFSQYKAISIISGKYIFTLVHPKGLGLFFDIEGFRSIFNDE
ncbi:4'-phosphopantetheinyl transferase family protein [Clostridium beijerinckii]|jgi:hypothetical protein|uniref:4'-phosphopantetheinyl transferase superfamily protein n=2 Tax=Clostridium beijerinckii TaxID=1520 RepID=A0AAE2RL73_CLOBE|nr:4'-phosphopantetheinyl transferase superfamily protein [Clostridium beijerinckii]ABR32873.1 4'-phosphopantetheinyl transferase [Clostridium beijerinckii NCIMB 8052]AIU01587.1 4'-phosphopantetheinyl transferase [Clostridium beijerinckii ATCC 35702]MBF7807450.1 4'-phosphopantetheinyl transferase superfamily protein [Clostridium beijerinckii]NOW88081.1 phosphopantetheinyl transferase (holo-ACP synthase) [Clostridium beijerinckii]NRT25887.1 phosphopantetheinyl transferase (holo-ACP synthase) [C